LFLEKQKHYSFLLRQFVYTFYRNANVSCLTKNNYQKETFILNGKVTYSLYHLSNNFLVATELIKATELPEKIQEKLA
jgi:hypothetical protein